MIISTTNPGGRAIPRAARETNPTSFGYRWTATDGPQLVAVLHGFDGKRYTVSLTDADCDAIKMAREKWATEFAEATR